MIHLYFSPTLHSLHGREVIPFWLIVSGHNWCLKGPINSFVYSFESLRNSHFWYISFIFFAELCYGVFVRVLCFHCAWLMVPYGVLQSYISQGEFRYFSISKQFSLWNCLFFLSGFVASISLLYMGVFWSVFISFCSISPLHSLKELTWVMAKASATGMFLLISLVINRF